MVQAVLWLALVIGQECIAVYNDYTLRVIVQYVNSKINHSTGKYSHAPKD